MYSRACNIFTLKNCWELIHISDRAVIVAGELGRSAKERLILALDKLNKVKIPLLFGFEDIVGNFLVLLFSLQCSIRLVSYNDYSIKESFLKLSRSAVHTIRKPINIFVSDNSAGSFLWATFYWYCLIECVNNPMIKRKKNLKKKRHKIQRKSTFIAF